jgi:hypothetical protein
MPLWHITVKMLLYLLWKYKFSPFIQGIKKRENINKTYSWESIIPHNTFQSYTEPLHLEKVWGFLNPTVEVVREMTNWWWNQTVAVVEC